MSNWRCRFGLHDWSIREVHFTGPDTAAIIERCGRCAAFRIPQGRCGRNRKTELVIPAGRASEFGFRVSDVEEKP